MPWHQINTRRISLQMCLFWNDGLNKYAFRTYGIGIKHFLQFFDGHKTAYYVDADDWRTYRAGQEQLLKQTPWVKTIPWEAQNFLELQLRRFSSTFPKHLPALTNKELLKLQRHVAREVGWTNSRTWMIYLINDLIADTVKQALLQRGKTIAETEQLLQILVNPLEPNEAIKERQALLRLALARNTLTADAFARQFAAHTANFRHIPMFGFDHDPYTREHFEQELAGITAPVQELHELERSLAVRQKEFTQALYTLALAPTDPLLDRILMLNHTVFVRDYRDTLRQKMYLLDRSMYEEIGRRLGGLAVAEAANLTNEEIASGLLKKNVFDFANIATERAQGFLVLQHDQTVRVYSGQHAFVKANEELGLTKQDNSATELSGVAASPGIARGSAKLVATNLDLGKIQTGDIMVAYVTRQDFVPAMRRSAAVVTSEGGITNHAAIIAREFGIPCVVGVAGAMEVVKDGGMIEVDGNRGMVRRVHE